MTTAMKLKRHLLLGRKAVRKLDSIYLVRLIFLEPGQSGFVFAFSHNVIFGNILSVSLSQT